jgi:hypothetical protein
MKPLTYDELKRRIRSAPESQSKTISKCMLILLDARELGPNPGALSRKTGLPLRFIQIVAARMKEAQLWTTSSVDTDEWEVPDDPIHSIGFFHHACVAAGLWKRAEMKTETIYRSKSGRFMCSWSIPTKPSSPRPPEVAYRPKRRIKIKNDVG